ncbi:MAG: c-type cytochrome [Caulobacterales bacterium]
MSALGSKAAISGLRQSRLLIVRPEEKQTFFGKKGPCSMGFDAKKGFYSFFLTLPSGPSSRRFAFALAVPLALGGCKPEPPARSPAEIAIHAASMAPAEPQVADLYVHSCKACHARAGSGAPLVGDRAAWAPRSAKGMTGLMSSVVQGFKGMPAGGQCYSCTADDYRALIRFMADQPLA